MHKCKKWFNIGLRGCQKAFSPSKSPLVKEMKFQLSSFVAAKGDFFLEEPGKEENLTRFG